MSYLIFLRLLPPKAIGFIALGGLLLTNASYASAQHWTDAHYSRYTFRTFVQYAPAQQEIDFERVDYPLLCAAIFYATNYYRYTHGVGRLRYHPALKEAAFHHSKDMAELGFFSHYSIVEGKARFTDRYRLANVPYTGAAAENIASSFGYRLKSGASYTEINGVLCYADSRKPLRRHSYISFANEVLKQWMNSPGHRENILNPAYQFLGCGAYLTESDFSIFDTPFYKIKSTQNFAAEMRKEY